MTGVPGADTAPQRGEQRKRKIHRVSDPRRYAGQMKKGWICLYGTWMKRLCCTVLSLLLCAATVWAVDGNRTRSLIPVGHTVGIKLFSKGVMVVKFPDGRTPAKDCGLRTGDVIVQCGGVPITSSEQFQSLLQESSPAELTVSRNGGEMTLRVEPERNESGVCQIGAWIRDSCAGIGTMTYYDPESNTFGCLGHGITDVDTALLMPFQDGSILPSTVKAVKKGEKGSAGELRGDFDQNANLGTLYANTDRGVFGALCAQADNLTERESVPTGEPVKGRAEILSNVRGDEVALYEIEILNVFPDSTDGRDMVLEITDSTLTALTGGIVQGMSGSPILQDGKFVGAVTHVLLQDPSRGYGISIENMLSAS